MADSIETDQKPTLWSKDFILAFIANLLMFFSFYLLVPVLPLYVIGHLHASESVAGIVLSLYTISALMIRPFSGFMVDAFARKPLYLVCYALFAVVFAGYVIAGTLTMFIVLRIVHGVAFGTNTVSGSTLAIDLMPAQRRGEGIGYFGMASSIAMAMGPMVGLFLYNSYTYDVIFLTSFATSIVGLMVIVFIKAPKKVIPEHKEVVSLDRFILVKGLQNAAVLFTVGLGYGVIANYIGVYSQELNLSGAAGLFFTLQALGIVGARLMSARAINRGQMTSTVYIGTTFLLVGYVVFALMPSSATFYICALVLGLGFGYLTPAFQTMFINLAEHNRRGTANSTYYIAWDFGIGTGIVIGGFVIEKYGFSTLYAICALSVIVGIIYFKTIAGPYFNKNRLR